MYSHNQSYSSGFSEFLTAVVFFGILGICFYYLCVYALETRMRFKTFSDKFSNLVFQNDSVGYEKYIAGKNVINLKNHPDFFHFRHTIFFNNFVYGIENTKIPVDSSYGLCAILTANYSSIRDKIAHISFLSKSRFELLKVYRICDEEQLHKLLLDKKDLISKHKRISDYSPEDLDSVLSFMKLYFLYLYCDEDPYMARNLDARKFYDFVIPQPLIYQSEYHCKVGCQCKQKYPSQPPYNPSFDDSYYPSAPPYPTNPTCPYPPTKPTCPYPVNDNMYPGFPQPPAPPAPGFKPEFLY